MQQVATTDQADGIHEVDGITADADGITADADQAEYARWQQYVGDAERDFWPAPKGLTKLISAAAKRLVRGGNA